MVNAVYNNVDYCARQTAVGTLTVADAVYIHAYFTKVDKRFFCCR